MEKVVEQYAEVRMGDENLGDLADKALFESQYLYVGKVAPEILGED